MFKDTPRQTLGLAAIGLALLLLVLGLQVGSHLRFRATREQAFHALLVRNQLAHTLRLLVDAETAQRGFLLTGQERYLEPYDRAQRELPQNLRTLGDLVDEPAQRAALVELEKLIAVKLDELSETLALEKGGEHAAALAVVKTDRGMHVQDEIRRVENEMESAAETRLSERYARAEQLSRIGVLASAIGSALVLAVAFLLLHAARGLRQRQQARIVALQEFAARVAHDIRNPVAAAMLTIDAVKGSLTEERAREELDHAQTTLHHVSSLVDDLLGFAGAGRPPERGAETEVGAVIHRAVGATQQSASERGVSLEIGEVCPTEVACSPGVLTSIVSNLLDNAVKYIGERPTKRVSVRALCERGVTRIEVRDTGPGVPSELHDKIFEPYVRAAGAAESGLGLGLATVRRLAEAHGGAAGIGDHVPSGSVFWVELPNVPSRQEAAPSRIGWSTRFWARARALRQG